MRRIDAAERRARLGRRHHLAVEARASDPVQAADGVVALHSTNPSSVYLSAWARMGGGDVAVVDRALYDERRMLRMLGMRRTVFVVPLETAPLVQAACARDIAERERRRLLAMLGETGVTGDLDAWLREAEQAALEALAARGEATATEIAGDDARLTTEVVLARGKAYEGRQKVASRVLFLLAASGLVVRARPRGTWNSGQYRWTLLDRWSPGAMPELPIETAEVELARRWLGAFGPALPDDLRWWTGWTVRQTRRALAGVPTAEVDLGGATGIVLAGDADPVPAVEPWAALLPSLDPTVMGFKYRDWYLGPHGPELFDGAGNASPTVWWDGRIVGGWVQRKDGQVVFELLEDVGADARAAIEREAVALTARIGDVRLNPRARGASAVERRLVAE